MGKTMREATTLVGDGYRGREEDKGTRGDLQDQAVEMSPETGRTTREATVVAL